MFVVENLIRNASSEKETLSILVINEGFDDYILSLAESMNHKFYLINGIAPGITQWSLQESASNIYLYNSIDALPEKHMDVILCFNRGKTFDIANQISNQLHVPLIVVDFCESNKLLPLPLTATINIPDQERAAYYYKNGDASVGVDNTVKRSWVGQVPSLSFEIPYPFSPFNEGGQRNKILIDTKMPTEFLNTLNLQGNPYVTQDPNEAFVYVHLWQVKTPLLYKCMSSKIPAIVFDREGFADLLNQKLCILGDNHIGIFSADSYQRLVQHEHLGELANQAYEFMSKNTLEDFSSKWNNIFNHVCNKTLLRG